MPINKEAYIRYRIIDECIRNKFRTYPSLNDIIETCEEKLGKTFSESTLQKDIKAMREDSLLGYHAPIKYSVVHRGYHYTDPNFTIASIPLNDNDIQAIEFAAHTLQQFKGIQLFEEFDYAVDKIFNAINIRSMLDEEEVDDYVQFEKAPFFKGSEYIGKLMEAIKNRQVISFNYQKFKSDEVKEHVLHPYLIKEYRHRWYLIGMNDDNDEIRTYGLDRIQNIEWGVEAFRFHPDFNSKAYFKHAYGITAFDGKPENVVLSFSPAQGNYIKTQPLHETQTILADNEKECKISVEVGITYELVQDILSYGRQVTVVEPSSLRKTVKKILTDAVGLYE